MSAVLILLLQFTIMPPRVDAVTAGPLTRMPYLTDLGTTTITVNWATDTSQTSASVQYGVAPNCSASTLAAGRTSITVGTVAEYQWAANISGLTGDTTYCYRVYLGTTDLLGTDPAPSFRTQIPAGSTTPFSFAVLGDWGDVDSTGKNTDQANVMQQIASSGVRFAITTGDTAYVGGTQLNYGDLQQSGAGTSTIFGPEFWTVPGRSIPLFNTSGNHGFNAVGLVNWPQTRTVATSGGRYQMDTYCCTNGTSSASYPSSWYAFQAGNARFYVLTAAWNEGNVGTADAYKNDYDNHWTPSSPEYQWLKSDLEAHPTALKFAFWHYPMYSDNSTENSSVYLQGSSTLEGMLASHGVDIGFSGHAHIYQRNRKPAGGIVTYLTGGGGAKLEPIGAQGCSSLDAYGIGWSYTNATGSQCGAAPRPTTQDQVFHFLKVSLNGTSVTVTPTDSLGRTFDVQTYTFSSATDEEAPTAPTNLTATGATSSKVTLSWTAATDNVGVTAYDVYRDDALIASLGNVTSYTDSSVAASRTYTFTTKARDAVGNVSSPSNAVTVTTPAADPTLTFSPTDDTYVQQSSPTKTAGSATTLQTDASPVKDILVKFNLSGLAGKTVTSASLRLYNTDPSPMGGAFYLTADASWSEATATWNNAPPTVGNPIQSVGSVSSGTWYTVDLSSVVHGDGVVSLRVRSTSSNGANYASSNTSATATRPQLVVTYAASAPSAPAAPTGLAANPDDARVALSWTASSDATSYNVKRATANGGPYATLATVAGTAYTDSSVTNGTTYYYVVSAVNNVGESTNSNQVAATPQASTRTFAFSDGFETGNLSKWTTSRGLVAQSAQTHSGAWAMQGNTTNGATYAKKTLATTYDDGYFRIYFYLAPGYTSQVNLLRYRTATDGSLAYLFVSTAGRLSLRNDVGAVTTSSTTTVTSGAWHALELHLSVNATGSSSDAWLDDVAVAGLSLSGQNWGTTPIGRIQIGEVQTGRTYNVSFDDVAFDTARIGLTL